MQFASFMPISTYFPQNPSCPKTLAFKTRHGPRVFQATCKKRKRHVTSSEVTRLHALLQLFSKTDGYYSQVLICPVPNWVPHQTNTRFATLDGRHALQTPMSATLPPWSCPPLQPLSMQLLSCIPIVMYFPKNLLVQNHQHSRRDHGPRGPQAASKQNRHVTCNSKACLHSLWQLVSKIARYNPQMLIFALQHLILYQS